MMILSVVSIIMVYQDSQWALMSQGRNHYRFIRDDNVVLSTRMILSFTPLCQQCSEFPFCLWSCLVLYLILVSIVLSPTKQMKRY